MRLFFFSLISIQSGAVAAAEFETSVRAFMKQYCLGCHDSTTQEGGLDLERILEERDLCSHHEIARAMIRHVGEDHDMPPEDADQPSTGERQRFVGFLQERMHNPDPATMDAPGFLPTHRLSNGQYRNTIRDLIGLGTEVVETFPQDDAVDGYDHVAAGLEFSSLHMERYLSAAHYIMDRVFLPAEVETHHIEAEGLTYTPRFGSAEWERNAKLPADWPESEATENFLRINRSGGVTIPIDVLQSGYYEVEVQLKIHFVDGPVGGRIHCWVDGKAEAAITHLSTRAKDWRSLSTKIMMKRGNRDLRFSWEGMNSFS